MGELNTFQIDCERSLRDLLDHHGLGVRAREIAGGTEKYVHLLVSESEIEIWIYEDEAEYRLERHHYNFELSYYRDKNKLLEAFLRALGEDLSNSRGA